APDEPDLEVMDLAALAPDEPDLEVMDLAALAPDEPELEVMDLAALAPDEPELEVMDLAALAPDEPDLEVMDLAALAPDEPDLEVMDLAALAPDEPSDRTPGGASVAPKEPSRSGSPVYTRTLADLYVRQGFTDKAIDVLRHLQERDPGDTEITDRIAQLEAGTYEARASSSAPESVKTPRSTGGMLVADTFGGASGHSEEDVEARARDLAESGEGADEVDTPFAWHDASDDRKKPETRGIGLYFDALLEWENRAES
ncbi:MAG: hypothetical protein OEN56_15415, partial [Gemmatimonadota bacterium]|nr:hypothetical protein [Gemmatimonadota bacterium]